MSAKCFTFALDCSMRSISVDLLRELSAQVVGYAGCADDTAKETAQAVAVAVAGASDAGVQVLALTFRSTAAGTLDIVLSSGEREVWRVSHDIP